MESSFQNGTKERVYYLDYLRTLAIIAVIVIHITGQNFYEYDVYGLGWQVVNFFNAIVRWAVPVLVMISGSLFLKKDISLNRLFKKNILRLLVSFVFWTLIYIIFAGNNEKRLNLVCNGVIHLWFIPMIIGLYLCIPIMKKLVENEKILRYYFLLSIIFTFLFSQIMNILGDYTGGSTEIVRQAISNIIGNMNLKILMGFPFYFMLGYYLDKKELSQKAEKLIFIIGIIGFLLTILLNSLTSLYVGKQLATYLGNFNINVLAESILVFVLFKKWKKSPGSLYPLVTKLSKYSFGAYLVHILILGALKNIFNIDSMTFPSLISIPLLLLIVGILSFLISFIINQIPFLKKYIV